MAEPQHLEKPLIGKDDCGEGEATLETDVLDGDSAVGASVPEADAYCTDLGVVLPQETNTVEWTSGILDCCEAPTSRCLYVCIPTNYCLSGFVIHWFRLLTKPYAGALVPVLYFCRHCRAGAWIQFLVGALYVCE